MALKSKKRSQNKSQQNKSQQNKSQQKKKKSRNNQRNQVNNQRNQVNNQNNQRNQGNNQGNNAKSKRKSLKKSYNKAMASKNQLKGKVQRKKQYKKRSQKKKQQQKKQRGGYYPSLNEMSSVLPTGMEDGQCKFNPDSTLDEGVAVSYDNEGNAHGCGKGFDAVADAERGRDTDLFELITELGEFDKTARTQKTISEGEASGDELNREQQNALIRAVGNYQLIKRYFATDEAQRETSFTRSELNKINAMLDSDVETKPNWENVIDTITDNDRINLVETGENPTLMSLPE